LDGVANPGLPAAGDPHPVILYTLNKKIGYFKNTPIFEVLTTTWNTYKFFFTA